MNLQTGMVFPLALLTGPGLHVLDRVGLALEHLVTAEGAGYDAGQMNLLMLL